MLLICEAAHMLQERLDEHLIWSVYVRYILSINLGRLYSLFTLSCLWTCAGICSTTLYFFDLVRKPELAELDCSVVPSHDRHACSRGWERIAELQNHRMLGVARDLCGSSSPTPLPKQRHLEQVAQDLIQAGFEPEKETPQPLWAACSSAPSPSK